MTEITKLDVHERKRFKQLDAIIKKGMATFLEVGRALAEIQNSKLYKEFGTFGQFVKVQYELSESRAYQFIDAAKVDTEISTMVEKIGIKTNERQLRELAKAPEGKAAEVLEKAVEISGDKPLTASAISKARKEIIVEEPPETIEAESEPIEKSEAEQAVDNAGCCKRIRGHVNTAIRELKELEEIPGTEIIVARSKSIISELESAKASISVTIPHSVCPRCNGDCCPQCGNHGWVNSQMYKELVS